MMSHTSAENRDQGFPAENLTQQVGALNLTSHKWHLVHENLKFNCALCQILTRADIKTPVHPAPPPQFSYSGFQLLTTLVGPEISNGSVDNLHDLLEGLATEFNTTTKNVTHLRSAVEDQNKTVQYFQVATQKYIDLEQLATYKAVIATNYSLIQVVRADLCFADNSTDTMRNASWNLATISKSIE